MCGAEVTSDSTKAMGTSVSLPGILQWIHTTLEMALVRRVASRANRRSRCQIGDRRQGRPFFRSGTGEIGSIDRSTTWNSARQPPLSIGPRRRSNQNQNANGQGRASVFPSISTQCGSSMIPLAPSFPSLDEILHDRCTKQVWPRSDHPLYFILFSSQIKTHVISNCCCSGRCRISSQRAQKRAFC